MKQRILYFDILRIMAALMVVMIHVSATYVVEDLTNKGNFIIGNILDSISRVAVPLFVMISGAFMLDENKELSMKKLLKKNVLNISIILVLWSLAYSVLFQVILKIAQSEPVSFSEAVKSFVLGPYHLWYLYMLIGIYLITPILRLFVKKENKNLVLYFVLIMIAFGFTANTLKIFDNGALNVIVSFLGQFMVPLGYLSYYLLGWYLANFSINKKISLAIYGAGILSVAYTILVTHFLSTSKGVVITFAYENLSLNILLYSVSVFLIIKQIFENREMPRLSKATTFLAKHTFGVYLIHIAVLAMFNRIIPTSMFAFGKICIAWVGTVIVSFIATIIISKIPLIKKLVRG